MIDNYINECIKNGDTLSLKELSVKINDAFKVIKNNNIDVFNKNYRDNLIDELGLNNCKFNVEFADDFFEDKCQINLPDDILIKYKKVISYIIKQLKFLFVRHDDMMNYITVVDLVDFSQNEIQLITIYANEITIESPRLFLTLFSNSNLFLIENDVMTPINILKWDQEVEVMELVGRNIRGNRFIENITNITYKDEIGNIKTINETKYFIGEVKPKFKDFISCDIKIGGKK